MTATRHSSDRSLAAASVDLTIAERLALLALLALIPFRAVIAETRTFETPRMLRNLDTPPGAMPATTMAIFAVILGAAVLVACVRLWRGGPRFRWTGAELGLLALIVAMTASTLRAGQKHLALTGSLDFLGLLLYVLTLRQLLIRPWHVRLALITVLATGAMVVAKCAYQRWVEIPSTIQYYEEHKDELTKDSQGDERAVGQLYDFEQRMRSGAVTGYFQHPNVLASYLILIILTAAAVVHGRLCKRPRWSLVAPAAIGLASLVALFFAQSKGAAAACITAILIWLIASRFAGFIQKRPLSTAVIFWSVFMLGAVGLVAALNAKPDALGRSMLFRSFYWRGASDMMRDQSLWGIGADNFGRLFSRYKQVECPEDVEDPHSWPVKAAAEWGMLGLIGLVAIFMGVSRRLVAAGPGPKIPDREDREPAQPGGSIILWTGAIGAMVFGWWMGLLSDSPKDYAILILYLPAISWVIAFIVSSCESRETRFVLDDPPGPMLAALCAGMIGFLVHAGVDLALFQGGAATTFFALMATALALRDPCWESAEVCAAAPAKKAAGALVGAIGFAATGVFLAAIVRPMAAEGAALQQARTHAEAKSSKDYQSSPGFQSYVRAADAWPLDATAIDELVEELLRRVSTVQDVDFVREYVQMMQARDRQNASIHHYFATLYSQRYRLGRDPADLQRSIGSMSQSIAAYPTSPTKRLVMANLYEHLAKLLNAPSAQELAAKELKTALDLDDKRIYVSKPNRLSNDVREKITRRIEQLTGVPPSP